MIPDRTTTLEDALARLTREQRAFTTDDVWAIVGAVDDGRSIANAMLRAERAGEIVNSRVGAYLRGEQRHRRWLTVWIVPRTGGTLVDAAAYAATRFGT